MSSKKVDESSPSFCEKVPKTVETGFTYVLYYCHIKQTRIYSNHSKCHAALNHSVYLNFKTYQSKNFKVDELNRRTDGEGL